VLLPPPPTRRKANSSGATKAKKKAGPPTLTVRIAEEMLVNGDEGALGNNIVAAGQWGDTAALQR